MEKSAIFFSKKRSPDSLERLAMCSVSSLGLFGEDSKMPEGKASKRVALVMDSRPANRLP